MLEQHEHGPDDNNTTVDGYTTVGLKFKTFSFNRRRLIKVSC